MWFAGWQLRRRRISRSPRAARRRRQCSTAAYVEQLEDRVLLSAVSFTQEVRVEATSDDAEESNVGGINLTSTDLELTEDDGSAQTVGMRFNRVDIPNGATITNAYVQFEVDEISTGAVALTIAGESSDDAAAFSSAAFDVSSRTTTSASVEWAPPEWNVVGAAGTDQRTPDLATIIQEIVSQPGWTAGNSLALMVTGTGSRAAESFNGDPGSAPLLHVDFEVDTIEESQIAASSDDAEERSTTSLVVLDSTDLELIRDERQTESFDQTVGMRFGNLAIPQSATIVNAYVQFVVDEIDTSATSLVIAAQASNDAPTFASLNNNISTRPTTAASVLWNPPAWNTVGASGLEQRTPDLSAVIQEVVDRPGWSFDNSIALIVTGTGTRTAESFDGISASAPLLHVEWNPPVIDYAREVKHAPRLQLGDAPLAGLPGSDTDQIEILWQTVPTGFDGDDSFTVEYRQVGAATWNAAVPVTTIDTGVDGRVVHSVEIDGLLYDSNYEYRVQHLRADGSVVETYQDTFKTRLPTGDATPFTFVAYGDSAYLPAVENFRGVQNQINLLDASPEVDVEFALLLGDNVYNSGTHAEADARFDPAINPEAADWIASRVDYAAFGNHDVRTAAGLPGEQNFASPVPVEGVTSPVAAPVGETPEHNYSFDYGDVHFVTFDTNSFDDPTRLDNQLAWLEADLAASTATWKLVFGHHPVAGVPDKSLDPGDNYYQQVVSRLRAAGADLLLVGDSHTYSWTYPLVGQVGGEATFVQDTDKDYLKGTGLVQLVAGTGGKSLRSGDHTQFPFVAAGFTTDTAPALEDGFARIDVSPNQLTVSYIAADDGAVLDSFTITDGPDTIAPEASLASPRDGSVDDFDPNVGEVLVASTQSFEIQLTDNGTGIDDSTVTAATVSVSRDGSAAAVDFSYDAVNDRITLTPSGGVSFDSGVYTISLSTGDAKVADLAPVPNVMVGETFAFEIDTSISTLSFQQDVNGYTGAQDTFLFTNQPDTPQGSQERFRWDQDVDGGEMTGLIQFGSIFGSGAGQIPVGATILRAALSYEIFNSGSSADVHEIAVPWDEAAVTVNTLGPTPGVQSSDYRAPLIDSASGALGSHSLDVTASLQNWTADPSQNHGWIYLANGAFGTHVRSSEYGVDSSLRPQLAVTFVNLPPEAEANGPYDGSEGSAIAFSSAGSSDADGSLVSFQWDFGDGNTATGANASHTYSDDGTYTVTLAVTDDRGATATDTATVTVSNAAPEADAGGPYSGNEATPIAFAGNATDVAADVLTYEWDFDYDGNTFDVDAAGIDLTSPANTYAADGTFTVALRVTDEDGGTSTISTATVTVANVAPTADAGGPYSGDEGASIAFAGSATDVAADVLTYEWDFDYDGITFDVDAAGIDLTSPANTYAADGTFTMALRVTDEDDGTSTISTATVTVANVAPTASAGGPYSGDEGTPITFGGSATDVAADVLTYEWDFDYDGNTFDVDAAGVDLTNLANTYADDGTFMVALRVTDDDGATSTISTATVTVANAAPTANAGGPYSGGDGTPITFSGSASDVSADVLTYEWDFAYDGNTFDVDAAGVDLTNPANTYADDGTFTVALRVTDDDGGTSTISTATVTVANAAPTADAGGPYSGDEGASIAFAGSATDVATDVLTYEWDFDYDGNTFDIDAAGVNLTGPANTYADDATFTVALRVTDDDGGTSTIDTATVTVFNVAPTADAGGPYSGDEGASIAFAGSATDVATDVLTYEWDFDYDGNTFDIDAAGVDLTNPTNTYADDGTFTVALRVTDDDGGTSTIDTTTVTVANVAPTADAGGPYSGDEGASIAFAGSATDVTADVLTYEWDFDYDGNTFDVDAVGIDLTSPTNTYADDGTFTVALRVTDDDGGTSTISTATVTVSNAAPTADAGGPYSGDEGTPISFGGSATDVSADVLTYEWDFDYDGNTFEVDAAGVDLTSPTNTYADDGTFTVALRVTDDDGATSTIDTTTVTVANAAPTADAGGPYSGDEGASIAFSGSANDVAADVLTYEWDFDYDGNTFDVDAAGIDLTSPANTYADDGTFTVVLRVTDDDGGTSTISTATVTVSNAAPTADVGGPYSGDEGTPITFGGSATDVAADVLTYEWDFDYDGITFDVDASGVDLTDPSNAYADDGTFTVALRVTDDDGGTSTIDTTTVTVVNVALVAPTTIAPTGDVNTATPEFRWLDVPGSARYDLLVRNLSTGQRAIRERSLTQTSYTPAPLAAGNYKWYLRAIDAAGNRSDWSAALGFSIVTVSIPDSPTLLSPTGQTADSTPTFSWTAVDGADRYHLTVKNLATGARPIGDRNLQGTEFTPTTALPPGTYRAWVRAYNSLGRPGDWSRSVLFEVVAEPQAASLASRDESSQPKLTPMDGTDELAESADEVMRAWPSIRWW